MATTPVFAPEPAAGPAPPRRTPPEVRLRFGALFWRIFLIAAVVCELMLWSYLQRRLGVRGRVRLSVLLLRTPRTIYRAFGIAAVATVVADGLVRLVLRPLLARWYAPRLRPDLDYGTPLAFHLGPSESPRAEFPARLRRGPFWTPGTLVITGHRVGFFPLAWGAEPWLEPLEELEEIHLAPPPKFGFGFVVGVPDRLVLRDGAGVDRTFAVADPLAVLDKLDDDLPARRILS